MTDSVVYQILVELEILNEIPYYTEDIVSLYIYRIPILKSGSMMVISFAMDIDLFPRAEEQIRNGKFPYLNMEIRLADNRKFRYRGLGDKVAGIYNRFIVVNAKARESQKSDNFQLLVSLTCCNVALYSMSTSRSFNQIFRQKTPLDILKEYEGHVTEKFGKNNYFNFKQLIDETALTKHTYKQILVKTNSDMHTPNWLLTTYKPSSNYCYYFFDDFIVLPGYKPVNGLLIDLSKKNVMEKFEFIDVTEEDNQDVLMSNKLNKIQPMGDRFGLMRNESATFFLYDGKNKTKSIKGGEVEKEIGNIESSETGEMFGGRTAEYHQTNSSAEMQSVNANTISIYCPDSVDLGEDRLQKCITFLKTDLQAIYTFELKEIHFDILQFFRRYNLSPGTSSTTFVPIGIVNIFLKVNPKEKLLTHSARLQAICYNIEEGGTSNLPSIGLPSFPSIKF